MVVILNFHVPGTASELGTALQTQEGAIIKLEPMVPGKEVPFFWIYAEDHDVIVNALRSQPAIESVEVVGTRGDAALIALEWYSESDSVFRGIAEFGAYLLRGVCRDEFWEFTVRFAEHERLTGFRRHCETHEIELSVDRIYHQMEPEKGPEFGLTEPQRKALALAVERGYYEIPRRCRTIELADELGISAQAVTERLRRGVANLARHTLLAGYPPQF
jgi:predicted DNA binding protein